VFATLDAEVPEPVSRRTWGLIWALTPRPGDAPPPPELMIRRGDYSYESQPDFFTSDLIDNYAGAAYSLGTDLFARKLLPESARALRDAWAMHWTYPEPALFLGYMAFQAKDYSLALRYYSMGAMLAERVVALAEDYRVLPDAAANFRRSSALDLSQLGVVSERLGDIEGAKAYYQKALAVYPLAQAHYNYAVLFWNKDWAVVERELSEAVRLDPGMTEARKFLDAARARRR